MSSANTYSSYNLFLEAPTAEILKEFVASIPGEIGVLPAGNSNTQEFRILSNSKSLRSENINPKTLRSIGGPGVEVHDFLRQPNVVLPTNLNAAVTQQVVGPSYTRIAFVPRRSPIQTDVPQLDARIVQALKILNTDASLAAEKFIAYTEYGCAEQCIGRTSLLDDGNYLAYRTRMYFSGIMIQDQISFFDKSSRSTALTIRLLNGKPSGFLLNEGGDVYLHGNEDSLRDSRVGLVQRLPKPSEVAHSAIEESEPVIALFEAIQNPALTSAILRGPFTDSHVWGWFKAEDNLPFFKNYQDEPTMFGEEEVEYGLLESNHGAMTSALATGAFKHPAIPFAVTDLMAGNFEKFMQNFRAVRPTQSLVASFSQGLILAAAQCEESGIGRGIFDHLDTAWIVGAGNSGDILMEDSRVCPQALHSPNLLKVAATAGKDALVSLSSFSERLVEIAELGCVPGKEYCADSEAATSYAAPRVARKVADLSKAFPEIDAKSILFALKATASVPASARSSQPLAVVSGGIVDGEAAALLLSNFATWPDRFNLLSEAWQQLLYSAKQNQHPGISLKLKSVLVKQEAETFMKRGDLK